MPSAEDYRSFAAGCLEIARHTSDPTTQALMLQMAQVWHRLADELDRSLKDRLSSKTRDKGGVDDTG